MPAAGLEPARGYPQQILSLHRLPFRHAGTNKYYISTENGRMQAELLGLPAFFVHMEIVEIGLLSLTKVIIYDNIRTVR